MLPIAHMKASRLEKGLWLRADNREKRAIDNRVSDPLIPPQVDHADDAGAPYEIRRGGQLPCR